MIHDFLLTGGLCTIAAFASGLWTTLFFRQTSAAFWFTLLVPIGVMLFPGKLFSGFSPVIADMGLAGCLGLYAAAGFFWAKNYFLRVQDVQWTGNLSLTVRSAARADLPRDAVRRRRPFRALLWNELQLQQINLVVGGLLLLSHIAVVLIRKVGAQYLIEHHHRMLLWALEAWPLLWLAMPLSIGSAAVAEERKLGTLEGLLTLPTGRRRKFVVKLTTALTLGIFLGAVVPLLVERLGASTPWPASGTRQNEVSTITFSLLSTGAIALISFYASTLTHNLLQALGLGLALNAFAVFSANFLSEVDSRPLFGSLPLWQESLFTFIVLPTVVVTIIFLAAGNFRRLQVNARRSWRNIYVIACTCIGAAALTSLIYHRVWEIWIPEEPPHRSYDWRPTHASQSERSESRDVMLEVSQSRVAILWANWLWLQQRSVTFRPVKRRDGVPREATIVTGPWQEGFAAGSNWRDVVVSDWHCFAIEANGSLWDLSDIRFDRNGSASGARRVDENHDWKQVATAQGHVLALKTNGTIWEWGSRLANSGTNVTFETISRPTQIGSDTDWIAVRESGHYRMALKSDGSIWKWGVVYSSNKFSILPEPAHWLQGPRVLHPESISMIYGKPIRSLSFDGIRVALVLFDGSLWIGGDRYDYEEFGRGEAGGRWSDVKLIGNGFIGVKEDGSLWEWRFESGWRWQRQEVPSRYSDWLAVNRSFDDGTFLALCYDGSLCEWKPFFSERGPYLAGNGNSQWYADVESGLLAPSRIKARKVADLGR